MSLAILVYSISKLGDLCRSRRRYGIASLAAPSPAACNAFEGKRKQRKRTIERLTEPTS
ncbi:MAG: hypothetical protein ACTSXQ_02640 [Alphaproteobacteria bacterium]